MSTEPMKFPTVTVQRKNGSERFHNSGALIQPTLSDFWRWGFSNVIDNTTRGVLAEFLVASALGIASGTRSLWDAYDLHLPSGLTIEVKSSAYLQAWGQTKLSEPLFSIRSARAYDAATNALARESKRHADVYVFCLEKHQDQNTLDPLDVSQWDFFVVRTQLINAHCGNQKSISLKKLQKMAVEPSDYASLQRTIEATTA